MQERRLGRYRLVRHLATGGMGEVYLAEASGVAGFTKRVVIKIMRDELARDEALMKRFVDEGRLLEVLDHPNIAQIHDLGVENGAYYLAMEYVEGHDLRALLRALPGAAGSGELDEVAVLALLSATAQALEHAADRRGPDGAPLAIVHHDVTPSNLVVRPDGLVKLVDFGIARSAVVARLDPGTLRGKVPYLSPEQALGEAVDARTDLFALGLVAIEALSGERALDVSETSGLPAAWRQLPKRVEALSGRVGAATLTLIADLVALDKAARPASAAAVRGRVDERLAALGEPAPARKLAAALAPAFADLDAASSSFDSTLSGLLGVSDAPGGGVVTGTVSLPGSGAALPAPAGAEPPRAAPELLGLSTDPQLTSGADTLARPVTSRRRVQLVALLVAALLGAGLMFVALTDGASAGRADERPDGAASIGVASIGGASIGVDLPGSAPPSTGPRIPPPAALPQTPSPSGVATAAAPRPTPAAEASGVPPPDGGAGTARDKAAATASTARPPPSRPSRATTARPVESVTARRARPPSVADAVLVFKVFPANAEVRLDGRAVSAHRENLYRIETSPGRRTIEVRDPMSGKRVQRRVRVRAGEQTVSAILVSPGGDPLAAP